MTTYTLTDNENNQYLLKVNSLGGTSLQFLTGSSRKRQPCVEIVVLGRSKTAQLESLQYAEACGENGLPRGREGTQSIVLASLSFVKTIVPRLEKFELQDNSHPLGNMLPPLSDILLLTKRRTYYQSFLPVQPKKASDRRRLATFIATVQGKVDGTFEELWSEVFEETGVDKNTIQSVWTTCIVRHCSWSDLITLLSQVIDANLFWRQYVQAFIEFLGLETIKYVVWEGKFADIDLHYTNYALVDGEVELGHALPHQNVTFNDLFDKDGGGSGGILNCTGRACQRSWYI